MFKLCFAIVVLITTSGCASIVNETIHPVRVETAKSDGALVSGAECKFSGEYGSTTLRSGETGSLRRSSRDIDVICKHADNPDASGRLISRANAGLAGNIIFGGIIGAVIDHNKGTAYTYPTWVRLVFGKSLIFDRGAEKDGQPVTGTEANSQP